jgi:hypothetical protein
MFTAEHKQQRRNELGTFIRSTIFLFVNFELNRVQMTDTRVSRSHKQVAQPSGPLASTYTENENRHCSYPLSITLTYAKCDNEKP